ncbi:MAG: lipase maturation factor family protein [Candidatus Colwellbacteria bacterium]|nr:lipase maturation factor family protein [Candidatus Colwellbacteria bacterium]
MQELTGYWLTRLLLQRGLGIIYLIAFLVALNQFVPLLGEKGLLPVSQYLKQVRFWEAPSLFFFYHRDIFFRICASLGVILSLTVITGISEKYGMGVSMTVWGLLWLLYLSFVNVGQTFYAFGWESMLLEAGFYAIFLGDLKTAPSVIMIWLFNWMLFRTMFGAGLIKLRGDECWKNLTCLYYHYETQPMPNPLSWFFHWLPKGVHQFGVLFNHFAELIVPFAYFAPQPISAAAGLITLLFHGWLAVSGNFSFLGFLTMVIALSTLDDRLLSKIIPLHPPANLALWQGYQNAIYILAIIIAFLSIKPIKNLFSPYQAMNTSYNPIHLVNSYGAFGSITRPRYEVIIEGTADPVITLETKWEEYEFKGKPVKLDRLPPQIAPYHLRLDWLAWFAGFSHYYEHPWFIHLMAKLLKNDEAILGLLKTNPFPAAPPHFVRALRYEYHFTTPAQHRQNGNWWERNLVGLYFPVVSLNNPEFKKILQAQAWED